MKMILLCGLIACGLAACADKPEVTPIEETEYPICREVGQTDCIPEPEPWPDGKPK
jgi:hypothetical protein